MPCIDGVVIAVPGANRRAFIDHASRTDPMFPELGATRVVECRGADRPAAVSPRAARTASDGPIRTARAACVSAA